MGRTKSSSVVLSLVTCVLLPALAAAQATTASGIAGVARDTSGGVLPGVTVEAASPALIERVRAAVTDGEGRYNIPDLRSGTYVVTFTLPGFSTFVRDGIMLSAGFTATVNADMRVGTLDETITVTGDAPLVDTQSARKQTVISSELLNVLPSSVKNLNNLVTLTLGFKGNEGFDVTGGYTGQVGSAGPAATAGPSANVNAYHGKGGQKVNFDGMSIQHAQGNQGYNQNQETIQETVLSTSGITAETNADGITINLVPKDGGNSFSGNVHGLYSGKGLQADNLTDALRARGLRTVTTVLEVFDVGATLGGPVVRDRLWFFGSYRQWGNDRGAAGKFYNLTQGTAFYTPDPSRPAYTHEWMESKALRLTWMATPRNKVSLFGDHQRDCHCPANVASGSINAPEAFFSYHLHPAGLYQATWNAPVTSRLLFEAGASVVQGSWPQFRQPEVGQRDISMVESTTGIRFNSLDFLRYYNDVPRYSQRGSMSYVTGSHAFKAGFQLEQAKYDLGIIVPPNDLNYTLRNGVPTGLTQWATPYFSRDRVRDYGYFAQDQWTIERLTLNYGVRFEYFNGFTPEQQVPATPNGWVPARTFAAAKHNPLWWDWNPRVGAAYDLFGDGRTALKMSIGRFVAKTGVTFTNNLNPITTSINSVTRTWNDSNGNFIPDCDLANRAANGECGAMANQNFGGRAITTRYAQDVLDGWGIRGYNWDFTAELQHQLAKGVSMSAGYYRNWYGNFWATDNTLVSPADFAPFCITAPSDARLPGGGGYDVCGLADVVPSKFGLVDSIVTQSSHFGDRQLVNDFFNVTLNARLGNGVLFGGGIDTGRSVDDRCFVVDSPQDLLNCRVVTPLSGNTQVKAFGTYPLPYDFLVSAVFQNIAGPDVTASYAATNAEAARSLGRDLAACSGRVPCPATVSVTRPDTPSGVGVPLIRPAQLWEDRMTRLDLRLARRFRTGARTVLQGNFNVYNVFNSSAVAVLNTNYGSRWLEPSRIQDGRMIQFSATFSY
ncbi:MAG TPA: carboxypeptidase regulatory-like domain-containing protein [Vicinamibacterales bacterium]